ncbi:MAG: YceD family protein [Pseudomonadota bacterium]
MGQSNLKIDVTRLPKSGKSISLAGDKTNLDFLSSSIEVDEVLDINAELLMKPWQMNGAELTGTMTIKLAQTCVTTLEPIETQYEFDLKRQFLPAADPCFKNQAIIDGELIIEPDADDLPDVIEGRNVDIWDVILEELNLHIDPYPRSDEFQWESQPEEEEIADTHKPFANLKTLITEKKPGNS